MDVPVSFTPSGGIEITWTSIWVFAGNDPNVEEYIQHIQRWINVRKTGTLIGATWGTGSTLIVGCVRDRVYSDWGYMRDRVYSDWGYMRDSVYSDWGYMRDRVYSDWGYMRDRVYSDCGYMSDRVYSDWGRLYEVQSGHPQYVQSGHPLHVQPGHPLYVQSGHPLSSCTI